MLKPRYYLAAALLPIAIAIALISQTNPPQTTTEDAAPIIVSTISPVIVDWPETINAGGRIAAWHEAQIASELSAVAVTAIYVDVGDKVKKGQLLATLNADSFNAELQRVKARIKSAQAALQQAQNNLQRVSGLSAVQAISAQDAEQFKVSVNTAEAELAAAKAEEELYQLKIRQSQLLAPDDGVIRQRSASLGQVVTAGTELFRLIRQQRIEWQAEIVPHYLPRLKLGQVAFIEQAHGKIIQGKITRLAPALASSNSLAVAHIELPADSNIAIGDYMSGTLALGVSPAVTVPSSAITWKDGHSYLHQIEEGRVKAIEVQVGRNQHDLVEISSSLSKSATIVRTGGAFLTSGDRVQPSSSPLI